MDSKGPFCRPDIPFFTSSTMNTMIWTNVNVYVTHGIFFLKNPFFLFLFLRAVGATGGSISSGVGE